MPITHATRQTEALKAGAAAASDGSSRAPQAISGAA